MTSKVISSYGEYSVAIILTSTFATLTRRWEGNSIVGGGTDVQLTGIIIENSRSYVYFYISTNYKYNSGVIGEQKNKQSYQK